MAQIPLATLDDTGNVPADQLGNAPGAGGGISQSAADARYVRQTGAGMPANVPVVVGSPTTGQALEWNGTAWAPATISGGGGGSSTLAGDSDVSVTSPATNQGLVYNGTHWVNVAIVNSIAGQTGALTLSAIGAAPTASPTFTGTVTVPTPTTGDNTTKAASTAYVLAEIGTLVGSGGLAITHTVSDANYPILATDQIVAISALTASRVFTLPTTGLTVGQQIVLWDKTGLVNWFPALAVGPVNGGVAAVLKEPYGKLTLTWNGSTFTTSGWAATARPAVITGTTYYVSAAGSNSNNGTSTATPWLTIAKANAQTLAPGDGVLFRGGDTFTDTFLTIASATAGTVGAPVVFGSYGTGQASLTKGVFIIGTSGASTSPNLVFDNLHFASTTAGNQGVQIGNSSSPCNNTTFQRCTFSDIGDTTTSSIGLYFTGNNHSAVGNYFHDWPLHGLKFGVTAGDSDGAVVYRNLFSNIGLNLSGPNPHSVYGLASNVTCHYNVCTSAPSWTSAISPRMRNWDIYGNHVAGCDGAFDYFESDTVAGTITYEQNEVYGATDYGIFISSADDGDGDAQTIQAIEIIRNHFEMTPGNQGNAMNALWSASGGYKIRGNTPEVG